MPTPGCRPPRCTAPSNSLDTASRQLSNGMCCAVLHPSWKVRANLSCRKRVETFVKIQHESQSQFEIRKPKPARHHGLALPPPATTNGPPMVHRDHIGSYTMKVWKQFQEMGFQQNKNHHIWKVLVYRMSFGCPTYHHGVRLTIGTSQKPSGDQGVGGFWNGRDSKACGSVDCRDLDAALHIYNHIVVIQLVSIFTYYNI